MHNFSWKLYHKQRKEYVVGCAINIRFIFAGFKRKNIKRKDQKKIIVFYMQDPLYIYKIHHTPKRTVKNTFTLNGLKW